MVDADLHYNSGDNPSVQRPDSTMVHFTPGHLIHYRAPSAGLPLWPAVVCADDVAPESFLRARPHGYVTLVVLLGRKLQPRWAQTSDMKVWNPFLFSADEESIEVIPDLANAYTIADSVLEGQIGPENLKSQLTNPILMDNSDDEEVNASEQALDSDSDPDLQRALRESLASSYGTGSAKRFRSLRTPSDSPPKHMKMRSARANAFNSREDVAESWEAKPKKTFLSLPFEASHPSQNRRESQAQSKPLANEFLDLKHNESSSFSDGGGGSASPSTPSKVRQTYFAPRSVLDGLLNHGQFGQSTSTPTSDIIEEDLAASKEYVNVSVGPEGAVFQFHKKDVWNRSYFRDPRSGKNYFSIDKDNNWVLEHPSLVKIEPMDFQFLAQYLESGQFGHQSPETGEQTKEAIAQCVSAWTNGEELDMHDLLEHIADKVGFLEWNPEDVLTFAKYVYETSGPAFDAQVMMKDFLSRYMAQHYWPYIRDDSNSRTFRKFLRKFPELEREVYRKRITMLDLKLEDADEESDDEWVDG